MGGHTSKQSRHLDLVHVPQIGVGASSPSGSRQHHLLSHHLRSPCRIQCLLSMHYLLYWFSPEHILLPYFLFSSVTVKVVV